MLMLTVKAIVELWHNLWCGIFANTTRLLKNPHQSTHAFSKVWGQ